MGTRTHTIRFRHHGRTIVGDLTFPSAMKGRVPAVLLVHGRAADRQYYWIPELRRRLTQRGYATLAIDLNGHGSSSGRFEDCTYFKAVQDVRAAADYLKRQRNVNPFAVGAIGHSLGGTAVLVAQSRGAGFKTLVLIAPVGDTKQHVRTAYPPAVVRAWKSTGSHMWYDARLKRDLSMRYSFYKDFKTYDSLKLARTIHQPVLVLHGTDDAAVPLSESRRLIGALHDLKKLVVIPGGRHSFRLPYQRRKLMSSVLPWFNEYLMKKSHRSVVAFLRHGDRYLTMHRSNEVGQYKGVWAMVGGHLPDGASPLAHAYTEVREETGITKRQLRHVCTARPIRLYDAELDITWIVTPVLFETSTRRVRTDWEHTAHRWVTLRSFPFEKSYPGVKKQFKALGLL